MHKKYISIQWRIQDHPRRGCQPSLRGRRDTILLKFPENCMKSRKIWSLGGGGCAPGASPRSATAIAPFSFCITSAKSWKKLIVPSEFVSCVPIWLKDLEHSPWVRPSSGRHTQMQL